MDDIIKDAREALALSYEFDKDNRKEAVEDLRFVAGFQWSDSARQERQGRPLITINRSGQFIRQVSNPIRQNMPTIKVEPDGDDDKDMADIANGLIRRIQYNSSASHVYANAVEHMVACGIGWFQVAQDYASDESFDQEIFIKRIFNPLSVYPDPSSLEPDRSDMNWCLVSEIWPNEAFKRKWPGKQLVSVDMPDNAASQQAVAWGNADTQRVAQYWRRKEVSKQVAQLTNGDIVDMDLLQKVAPQYADQVKPHIANTRSVKGHKVEMVMVSGAEILEDPYECPCKWIPIIPVIGNEVPLEQGTYRHGLIRFQREPQQLHNYFMSVAAETLGQQPKSPYVVVAKTIAKWKTLWDNANRNPTPYLPYDPDPTAPNGGRPERIAPPPLPAGLIQMAQMLSDDMKATTGIYDAALGAQSNETSGVAIGARVQQGDQATFHYVDNLEHGLEHLGRILLDMIPKVYDNDRTIRIKNADDTERTVAINRPVMAVDGESIVHNDLSKMSFNSVRVVLGPSFASRKQQAAQMLLQLIQAVPDVAAVAGDLIAKNLDFDGSEELRERLHALLPPPILQLEEGGPGGQPGQPPGPPQPSPAEQMAQQAQMQMLQEETAASHAKTIQAEAQARSAEADAQTALLKTHGAELDNALKMKKLSEPPPERSSSRPEKAD